MNNSLKIICVVHFILSAGISYSQKWTTVGNGFNFYPDKLIHEPNNNVLYAVGSFTKTGEIPLHYAAQFTGTGWDSIPFLAGNYADRNVFSYNGDILFGHDPILRWNGTQLDTFLKFSGGGSGRGFLVYNNDLVVYGSFDSINGLAARSIAKWDGVNWSAFDTTIWYQPIVAAIEYKGELYIGGNMSNYNGSMKRLARWNGAQWQPVDSGIRGGFASVGSFEIYDNDLYIAGGFSSVDSNPGNCIARWDGTHWKNAGVGVTSANAAIFDLQVYNNELFACGQFTEMDGMPINGIAKWDGNRWCGLGQNGQPNYTINCMAVYDDELYVGGPFLTIDGDTMNYVAKWVGNDFTDTCGLTTGVKEPNGKVDWQLYPNPSTGKLTIQSSAASFSFQILSTDGRVLMQSTAVQQPNFDVDVSALPAGLYFLQLWDGGHQVVKKFVKE
ncbi:MAG TPA: T9SS type A sorting domain-containing protein [Chitinophagales bacterium]|nr:T9SS type A sorting domain-containing protein [Chitinophagales bacterium]